MTKEYLSKFIGYYLNQIKNGVHFENHIILIRPQWWLPDVILKFCMDTRREGGFTYIQGPGEGYEDALSKVKEYFYGK